MTIVGTSPSTSPVGVVNALNALFTVNPLGAGYVPTVILPVSSGVATTNNLQEGNTPVTGDPVHLYTTGSDTSSGHGARLGLMKPLTLLANTRSKSYRSR